MCPDREILSAYFDGEVSDPWARQIAEHVSGCGSCRAWLAGLDGTRRVLAEERLLEWRAPMERVRRRILAHHPVERPRVSIWRRQMTLPVPVAGLAAALLLILGISLAVVSTRQDLGYIRITQAPAGGTEYQFAVPYDKVEALLKSVGGSDAAIESVMTIPKNVKLVPVGQPRMGKADEFPRKKP
ncbi:MAG TPA: zf-HC2 domain-containing protein [Spirochaetia bacterium]|nr:zf-HC2 domain-containing protein [Spirochaetia bacterium]